MSSRKTLKSVEIKVPNNVKVTVNGLNRKSEKAYLLNLFSFEKFNIGFISELMRI